MRRWVVLSILLLLGFAACSGGDRPDANCEWPQETAISLDLRNPTQQQHLTDDALRAEDLAIRFADSRRGPRSGHFAGFPVYGRTRDECMVALFSTIARNHGVTTEQVRESLGRRRTTLDAAVFVSFAVFYWFGADLLARRLCRRFPLDEGWPGALVSTIATSVAMSIIGVLLGEQWSILAESIRLGTGHLSYRTFRIPWVQHRMQLFAAGVLLFWLAAVLRYGVQARQISIAKS